jgi:multiple sugar transport system substrate-binding protein
MTWNHDRGLAPMLATAAKFAETHKGIQIEWTARSLQGFADHSIDLLAGEFDLIVLDHPFMGTAARGGYLVPLDENISPDILQTLRRESVGVSHDSYFYQGHQWALAIDAAAQVAGYRADLMEAAGAKIPTTWEEVHDLEKLRPGFVTTPLLPVDAFCSFVTLCANSGHPPFSSGDNIVPREAGKLALQTLKELAESAPKETLAWNPIAVWEKMSTTDETAYCPLAFGYSNYARAGYRRSQIKFTNIPSRGPLGPSGSILGGAGLAVSAKSNAIQIAVEYATWVASAECQKTIYVESGGQPGNRRAWTDPSVNEVSNHFFEDTLTTLERAYLRPRFPGFIDFQTEASSLISQFLKGGWSSSDTLQRLERCYLRRKP